MPALKPNTVSKNATDTALSVTGTNELICYRQVKILLLVTFLYRCKPGTIPWRALLPNRFVNGTENTSAPFHS